MKKYVKNSQMPQARLKAWQVASPPTLYYKVKECNNNRLHLNVNYSILILHNIYFTTKHSLYPNVLILESNS